MEKAMRGLYSIILSLGLLVLSANAQADPISDLADCIDKGNTRTECHRSEARRYVGMIEAKYEQYGKDSYFNQFYMENTKTNDEKFRKLMNMWKLYAQNYCNLAAYVYKAEQVEGDRDECLYNMAIRQLSEIEGIESARESDTF